MDADMEINEYLNERGQSTIDIKSPKMNSTFQVYKTEDGYSFFGVRIKGGEGSLVPKELSGRYTKLSWAKDAVVFYLNQAKESASVQRDKKTAIREARKTNAK